jgi:hypothetical protein
MDRSAGSAGSRCPAAAWPLGSGRFANCRLTVRRPEGVEMSSPKDMEPERTLTLSPDDARKIAHFLSLLLDIGSSPGAAQSRERAAETPDRATLTARARAVLAERKRRTVLFPAVLFGEIAWEMLLWLYVTEDEGERQTIGRLANLVGAPHTTALRWIGYLEKEGLIERKPHPNDRRTVFVHLLNEGRNHLDRWFASLAEPLVSN